ncbi:MAG: type II toxin-antitoxin system VapC family toxin [Planctomycetaceae bacterium]|nr:type II toxin-antitoxin system VapC family toxin [Planctomycetaceae bacterium]
MDTNVVIALLKRESQVLHQFNASVRVMLPAPVVGELKYGALLSSRSQESLDRIDELVASCEILSVDLNTAPHYASIKRALRDSGRPIPENDIWIAALARQYDLPLVTRDAHFQVIHDIQLLSW